MILCHHKPYVFIIGSMEKDAICLRLNKTQLSVVVNHPIDSMRARQHTPYNTKAIGSAPFDLSVSIQCKF
jgi:hypothetical protein